MSNPDERLLMLSIGPSNDVHLLGATATGDVSDEGEQWLKGHAETLKVNERRQVILVRLVEIVREPLVVDD